MENQISSLTISEEYKMRIVSERKKARIIRLAPILILLVLIVFFSVTCKGFFSFSNLTSVLNQLSIPLILGLGLTFIILMGSIDLSIDGVMGLAGSIVSLLVLNGTNNMNLGVVGVLIAICVGATAGFMSGLIHVKAKLPSFMVTYGMSSIASGVALLSYHAIPVSIKEPFFTTIAQGSFIGIPLLTWISLLVFAIAFIMQEYSRIGRYVFAIGANETIPRQTGINVDRVKILVFTWCGVCIGIAGVLGAMRLGRGEVAIGTGNLFPAITAVVVGGTSLSGGKGGVINTLLGALIVTILKNGLILLGVNPYIQTGIMGMIIVAAVAFSVTRGNKIINK